MTYNGHLDDNGTYWKAFYDNGTMFDGDYSAIDRDHLLRFEVYDHRRAVYPSLSVDVPAGVRLVHRRRVNATHGWSFTMVALESADRTNVDLHVLAPQDDGTTIVHHQAGYQGDYLWAPELLASET